MFNQQIGAMGILGRGFPDGPAAETVSHYSGEFRSPISRWGPSGKLRPALKRQNGMRFPVEVYSGKRVPESALRLGCNFPIEPLEEAASRNPRSKRDMVSQTGLLRKMQPGIPARNGTRFPSRGPMGNCIPPSRAKQGRSFRAGHQRQSCGGIVPAWAG